MVLVPALMPNINPVLETVATAVFEDNQALRAAGDPEPVN
jgi:hypothetical protein